MRSAVAVGVCLSIAATVAAADDPLARARALYNQRDFQGALSAAEQVRVLPGRADSADLIAARAYLERYRESAASDDLENARERLRRMDPHKLAPVERGEYVVGLGEALYFENAFGAAAAVFHSVIVRDDALLPDARERALDWWATSVDRDARPRPELDRQAMYQRVRDAMQHELGINAASATAAYWLAFAARAQGDVQAAWEAAEAAWVRAPLAPDHGEALRGDLDRLVLRAIVPERAKATSQPPDSVRLDWERFKERWKKE